MTEIERLSLTAETPKEQIMQIRSYLFKLAEQLEMILDNIDEQNFSASFVKRLDGMQGKTIIEQTVTESADVHVIVDTDPGVGTSVDYADGTIILVKEGE